VIAACRAGISTLNGSPLIIENFLVRLRAGGQKPLFIAPGGWGGENEMLVFSSMLPFLEKDMPIYGIFSRALDELVVCSGARR